MTGICPACGNRDCQKDIVWDHDAAPGDEAEPFHKGEYKDEHYRGKTLSIPTDEVEANY